ncbi:MAG TPA: AtpZ/AtpI family protein [Terracidiphilus sp.]|jgi:ATP synthase protein I|nr:AtpZ/AtpI family protein [Terracidiphilus sp.]
MPFHRPIPDANPRGKRSGIVDAIVQAEKLIQIALVLPCAAFIGWLGGAWLDSRLHQSWIGLVGIVFGGASGLIYVIRLALTTDKDSNRNNDGGAGTAS